MSLKTFTLNHWPPLASHLAAFLLGIALVHLGSYARGTVLSLPERNVIFTLGIRDVAFLESIKDKRNVYLAFKSSKGECRFHEQALEVLQVSPQLVLSSSWKGALVILERLAKVKTQRNSDGSSLGLTVSTDDLPFCDLRERISYSEGK